MRDFVVAAEQGPRDESGQDDEPRKLLIATMVDAESQHIHTEDSLAVPTAACQSGFLQSMVYCYNSLPL